MMPETQPKPIIRMPILVLPGELESPLPLEHTLVHAQVTGLLVGLVVTQRFGNPLREPAELEYLFPLADDASMVGFEIRVGDRLVEGDLQEREIARDTYEEARGQGKRAGLFEQRRLNLFSVRLANIQPGEVISATFRCQQRLKFSDGVYEFVFPMGLTPKYDRPGQTQESAGVHAPIVQAGEKIGPVEIQVAVDAGMAVSDPTSPSHPLELVRVDDRRFQVRLAGEQIPDHDFVLRYTPVSLQAGLAGWRSGAPGKEFFLATIVPPRSAEEPAQEGRDFIFVLDRSGSMSGEPIAQARNALRACLRALNPVDTFRILLFDHEIEWFQPEPAAVTQEWIEKADLYLGQVQGRGGTEILGAIDSVLSLPPDQARTRFVVFLSDGAVSAEAQALENLRARIASARLFTFGIGPSVNRALLSRMARLGRGRAAFLQLDEDIEGAIISFQDSVSFPMITGLTLEWENAKSWDVFPARLPDLYEGQALEISGRLAQTGQGPARLTARGQRLGQPVVLQLDIPQPSGEDAAVARVWARARVEDLSEQQELEPARAEKIREDILALALEHGLVTQFTSFVAVDKETTGGGKPRIIRVSQPLPQGLHPGAFLQPVQVSPQSVSFASFIGSAPPPAPSPSAARPASAMMQPMRSFPRVSSKMVRDDSQPKVLYEEPKVTNRETGLRWLARSQMIDGSWNGDVESTAAALLAFVHAGQTPRSGSFRQALRRAVGWLVDHPQSGFAGFVRACALRELAQVTSNEHDLAAAREAVKALPAPASDLERAALGEAVSAPAVIQSLDDLRLASLLHLRLPVQEQLKEGSQAGLVLIWSITIM